MNTPHLLDKVGAATLSVIGQVDHFNLWMYQTIRPYLKGEVLELGSGIGNISKFLIKDNFPITLSDFNLHYCSYLKEQFLSFEKVQDVVTIDLQHPNFEEEYQRYENRFDSIFLLNVIEHLKDDFSAVKNCRFLLKQNGHLVVLAPAYGWLYCRFDKELGHFRRYTKATLSKPFLTHRFRIASRQYFNLLGIAGWLLFGKLLNRKLIGSREMSAYEHLVPLAKWLDRLAVKQIGLSVIIVGVKE